MYGYFATAAASGATIKAIKCKLVKDSSKEYIVCLKNHSLEVYSLYNKVNLTNGYKDNQHNLPILTTTLNANSTFVYFIEYRPPGDNQSHLLVLTHNYTLLLLTYDDNQSKFISRSVSSLQDDFSTPKYGNIIFKVDRGYNLLLFYGHSMVIKCIVLNKKNYFNFTDIVTMRTNDSLFLDIEFMSVEYKASTKSKSGDEFNSVSFTGSLNQDMQFKLPNKNTTIEYLECKLLILGQDTDCSLQVEPVRWLYGIQLFFEIEILNEYKRFNSYTYVPLLGDPLNLNSPYNKFIPLSLNNKTNQTDSIIMLGPGSVGYSSFKNPKEVRNFKLDYSTTEISCYVKYDENKYVFGDDDGSIYMMEVFLSSSNIGTGLKRRVGSLTIINSSSNSHTSVTTSNNNSLTSVSNSSTVYTNKSPRELMVSDVVVRNIGKCSVPSSIVKLDQNRVFCTSKLGNSCTLQINSNEKYDEQQYEYKEWTHTNIGPITDFVHMEDSVDGTRSILACCGIGNTGSLCKIYLGLASDNLFSNEVTGVQNLFCVSLSLNGDVNDKNSYSVLCLSYYRFTQFYLVNLSSFKTNNKNKNKNKKVSLLDNDETRVGEITKFDKKVFISEENTVLFKRLKNNNILQVTSTNVLIVDSNFNLVKRVSLSNLLKYENSSDNEERYKDKNKNRKEVDVNYNVKRTVMLSLLCGYYVLLILSNNSFLLLDYNLNVIKNKKLQLNVSSATYISQNDINESMLKNYKDSKNTNLDESEGMLAISSWDNKILVLSLKELEVLHYHSLTTNFGTYVNSMKFIKVGSEVYLLVGVSDGKLHVYNLSKSVNELETPDYNHNNNNDNLKFKLDNMLEMTNKSFKMLEINRYPSDDTCDLGKVNIITTGQKCNIIYLRNNKIEYAKTNFTNLTALTTLSTGFGVSNPFYNNKNNKNGYDMANVELLVVYYDNKNLYISKLNVVKNMNLQRILSGRSFNKVIYHSNSKLAVLSTVPQYLVDPNNLKNFNSDRNGYNSNLNCKTNIDDKNNDKYRNEEHEDHIRNHYKNDSQDLETQNNDNNNNNMLMCIDDNEVLQKSNTLKLPSCLMLVDLENKEVTYTMNIVEGHQVSSLMNFNYQGVEYVVVGTAKVSEADEEPVEGFLYILEIDNDGCDSYRFSVQRTCEPFNGGVVEMTSFKDMLVVAVNSTVLLVKPNLKSSINSGIKRDRFEVEEGSQKRVEIDINGNRKVYKLEYINEEDYINDEQKNFLEIITNYECNTYVVSMDTYGDTLLVGDLMTSVKMLKFKDNYLYEVCRDFKTLWTTSLVAIDENKCLVSDDSGNFIVFSSNKKPVNDQQSIQFESLGLFHHGEIVNKMLKFNKKNKELLEINGNIASKLGKKSYTCNRSFCCQTIKAEPEEIKQKKYTNLFDNMYTCVTSSGSILQVCFFDDLKLFLKLSVLEQTMLMIQSEIGNNFNRNHRNFQNLHTNTYTKGFLDGDLIESFLKLPDTLKNKVFKSIIMHSTNIDLELTTVDNLVSDIENIRQSRLQ